MANKETIERLDEPTSTKELFGVLNELAKEKSLGLDGWATKLLVFFFDMMGSNSSR